LHRSVEQALASAVQAVPAVFTASVGQVALEPEQVFDEIALVRGGAARRSGRDEGARCGTARAGGAVLSAEIAALTDPRLGEAVAAAGGLVGGDAGGPGGARLSIDIRVAAYAPIALTIWYSDAWAISVPEPPVVSTLPSAV
jgi:hypothetical protein